ncbi:MAG: lipoprotein [Gammaproteobacteria bacterium]|nr:lipoprotein [Gammaproteobacteria bacterium]
MIYPLKTLLWAVPIAAGLLLGACGQKGPLYLPSPEEQAANNQSQTQGSETEQEKAE